MASGMPIQYSGGLIAASVTISMLAAYAAFCFAERVTLSTGHRRSWWLGSGSVVLGLGIWSMHYLGMLAVHMQMEVVYSIRIVGVSLLWAIAASAVALGMVSRQRVQPKQLLAGGVLMGAGIGGMHYTGMAAMRSCMTQHYSPALVVLSVVVAASFSWVSLLITFRLRDASQQAEWLRVLGATVMGSGIASMHYTAMSAVSFYPGPKIRLPETGVIRSGHIGALGVGAAAFLVLGSALLTMLLDRANSRVLARAQRQLAQAQQQLELQKALVASQEALHEANRLLTELSVRDGLTSLYNRRHFDLTLEAEWAQASRKSLPITLLMIDLDCFKLLNDAYGHSTGDEVLRGVGSALTQAAEDYRGVLARYGGEEFAAIFHDLPAEDGIVLAERMRASVYSLDVEHEKSRHGRVTISVGLYTVMPAPHLSALDAMRIADKALYRAKALGRNRVEVAKEYEKLPAKAGYNVLLQGASPTALS